ncbi:MAG: PP2C family protein-serine/threonine phosphatase [Vicinamibacterales bacterium]
MPRILAESVAVAFAAYVVAGAAETTIIRIVRPTEWELAWVSDLVLATALGVAVYLWRHLSAARSELVAAERAALVLDTQMALAADLQRRLLPELPADADGLRWAARLTSAHRVGGDFYDLVPAGEGRWMVLVADVSGKGVPAAMALSTLRAAFRYIARMDAAPAAVLTRLSAALFDQWSGAPYVTAAVALVDPVDGSLRYANAGHPPAFVVGASGAQRLEALGPPAALFAGTVYDERRVALRPGDVCVFVSDGVTEALGDQAAVVVNALVEAGAADPRRAWRLCDAIMAAAIAGDGPADVRDWTDDRTVVVLALDGEPAAGGPARPPASGRSEAASRPGDAAAP